MIADRKTNSIKETGNIPPIIHQVYEAMEGPSEALIEISKSWKKFHPEWEYRFWNKETMENFLHADFPDFLSVYRNYPFDVQRWDAIRYLLLYRFGGLYVDMDYECLASLDILLQDSDCCLGLEPKLHSREFNIPYSVGNALMATIPNHLFFKTIIEDLIVNQHTIFSKYSTQQILASTGPFMITRIYNDYLNNEQIKLLPDELIAPLSLQEVRMMVTENQSEEIEHKIEKAYAIHYFMGSWHSQAK